MKTNKAFTLIELMVVLAIIFILAATILGAAGGLSVSDGTRSGTLTKFSHKGLVNKSWEGELVMGGMRQVATTSGSTGVANVWSFSVMNSELATKLEGYVGQEVKLKYHQSAFRNPLRRDTSYEVISIEATHAEK